MLNKNQVTSLIKRIADASEKFALAGLALGVFQDNGAAGMIGLAFLGFCLILTIVGGAR